MAKLADYGILNYEAVADYKIPVQTIDTMLELLTFPLLDESVDNDGITINFFEKSFWGKKHRGFISLKYIDNVKADTSKFDYDAGTDIPENSEILIGLEFSSTLENYKLGKPRKQILSYGILMSNLNAQYNAIMELYTEQIQTNFLSSSIDILHGRSTEISNVRRKFKVFEKYIAVPQ